MKTTISPSLTQVNGRWATTPIHFERESQSSFITISVPRSSHANSPRAELRMKLSELLAAVRVLQEAP